MSLDEFLRFARSTGYEGVEIRYGQLPLETPAARLAEIKKQLGDLGLTWVFGTVEGIADEKMLDRARRTMENNLSCGCLFTRFTIKKPEHIQWAQRFADAASQQGAKLIMQMHCHTLPDNVPHALATLAQINRPNVGLTYEANHLVFDGDMNYAEAVLKLAPHIRAVSVQNFKSAPADSPDSFQIRSKTYVRAFPGDPEAVDFPSVFRSLKKIGFDGFVTVMTDAIPGFNSRELSKRWFEYLRPLIE